MSLIRDGRHTGEQEVSIGSTRDRYSVLLIVVGVVAPGKTCFIFLKIPYAFL